MAATAITVPGAYNLVRTALPEKDVPPYSNGINIWTALKYDATNGIVVNAWNDPTTDFKKVDTFGAPTLIAGSSVMGTKQVMVWPTTPTPRVLMKNSIYLPINKFSMHMVFTVNGVDGGSGNRCIFSFIDKLATKYFSIYGTSSSAQPPRLNTAFGNIVELGTQTATITPYTISYTPATNRKEVMSVVYDATVTGGTFYVYYQGALINTFNNVGQFTLDGTGYLGADLRSSTNSSDFKGELGTFIIDEKARSVTEIAPIHTYLSTAFS